LPLNLFVLRFNYFFLLSFLLWLGGIIVNFKTYFFSLLMEQSQFILSYFIVMVEFTRILTRFITLRLRIFINVLLGEVIIFYYGNLNKKIFIIFLLFIFEAGVFFVQSYLFVFLVIRYLEE
jgi:F0F1-type ATP synthase membrane subunit a